MHNTLQQSDVIEEDVGLRQQKIHVCVGSLGANSIHT